MIRSELSHWLGMIFFRHFIIVNVGFVLAALCFSLIFYRAYRARDGVFRLRLLWYFGSAAFYCYGSALLWHPFFNEWMQFLLVLPHLFALLNLTHFMVINFRGYGENEQSDHKMITKEELKSLITEIMKEHCHAANQQKE